MVAQLGGKLQCLAVFHIGGAQGMTFKVAENGAVGHHTVEVEDESGDRGEVYFVH